MTAQDRVNRWAEGSLYNSAQVESTIRWGYTYPEANERGVAMWEGWAKRAAGGLHIAVEAGPRATPEEVCELLIERLAAAGVLVA